MKQQSPMLRLWELGEGQQGGLKRAVLSAVVGVLFGMLPYFAVAQIILGLLSGNQESSFYLTWCAVALVGFLLRATLYSLALSQSHKATFAILKSIREKVLEKLPKMPLGTILDTSSGQMKQIIVDQVESMERPLAHVFCVRSTAVRRGNAPARPAPFRHESGVCDRWHRWILPQKRCAEAA